MRDDLFDVSVFIEHPTCGGGRVGFLNPNLLGTIKNKFPAVLDEHLLAIEINVELQAVSFTEVGQGINPGGLL